MTPLHFIHVANILITRFLVTEQENHKMHLPHTAEQIAEISHSCDSSTQILNPKNLKIIFVLKVKLYSVFYQHNSRG